MREFFDKYSLWISTARFAIITFGLFSLYHTALATRYSLYLANKSMADTAVVLIGLSFALSGISFFWKPATKFLGYRKQLGVVGFVVGLIHGSISLAGLPNIFPFPSFFIAHLPAILFASL